MATTKVTTNPRKKRPSKKRLAVKSKTPEAVVLTQKKTKKFSAFAGPLVGLLVAAIVVLAMNGQFLFAQAILWIHPADASAAQFSPNEAVAPVSDAPRIIVPKLNIDAPVVYDLTSSDEEVIQKALERGVVHLAGSAFPGSQGNAVFVGHSSNDVWKPGDYKFIFAILENLNVGDEYALNYQGTRYVYKVTQKTVVEPSDISVLKSDSSAVSTLITCTPTGTSLKRLVIKGQQVSPIVVHRSVSGQAQPTVYTLPR